MGRESKVQGAGVGVWQCGRVWAGKQEARGGTGGEREDKGN